MPLFSTRLPCCALIFLRSYPAVSLIFFALTLLCAYFSARLPCCAFKFYFFLHLPCCAIIMLFAYHLVTLLCLYFSAHSCCVLIFFRICPAVRLFFCTIFFASRISSKQPEPNVIQSETHQKQKQSIELPIIHSFFKVCHP